MPLQVIETTDPLANLIRFQTSAIYETIISLQVPLHRLKRHAEWIAAAEAALPPRFWQELNAIYVPFFKGGAFFELAVDYPDHDDMPGFISYVREMDPASFMFYVVGRIITREEITRLGMNAPLIREAVEAEGLECWCIKAPLEQILDNVPQFQRRLASLWEWYWDDFFSDQIEHIRPHWERGLDEKVNILERQGGQALWDHVTGKPSLPPPLPADHPFTDISFVPVYLTPKPVYLFYGYGNITVVYDTERTEARRDEIARAREEALDVLKALGDSTRLEIMRLIVRSDGQLHGKQIATKLNLSPSAVSRHLAQLKEAGLITEESPDNRTITYSAQTEVITGLPERILDYLYLG